MDTHGNLRAVISRERGPEWLVRSLGRRGELRRLRALRGSVLERVLNAVPSALRPVALAPVRDD